MSFYTLISKTSFSAKKWIKKVFIITFIFSFVIIVVNYIIDPYNVTGYNILNIKYKFARDDRSEKLAHFKVLPKFDNILIGSSRVYSINPRVVSKILGGTTYNFGVGTATVEDHLGILKYLIKEHKVPKNIIIGVDFYTFNPEVPPNGYFIKNKELNFLSYGDYHEDILAKLFSIDAFRASIRTIKYNFFVKNQKPRFDELGWAGGYSNYSKIDLQKELVRVKKEIEEEKTKIYSNFKYNHIDKKRISYYEELKKLAKLYNIKIYIFTTPLHPLLLNELKKHPTKQALNEFVKYLSSFENFNNLYYNPLIYNNLRNFHGATHTSANCGDIMMDIVLKKEVK